MDRGAPRLHLAEEGVRGHLRHRPRLGARVRLRHRLQRQRDRRRLDPYPPPRRAGAGLPGHGHLAGGGAGEVRLPPRGLRLRRPAARRHRLRLGPHRLAPRAHRLDPRRHRLPEVRWRLRPADRRPGADHARAAQGGRRRREAGRRRLPPPRAHPRSARSRAEPAGSWAARRPRRSYAVRPSRADGIRNAGDRSTTARGPLGQDGVVAERSVRAPDDVLVHLRRARDVADRDYAEPLDLERARRRGPALEVPLPPPLPGDLRRHARRVRVEAADRAGAGPAALDQPHRHRGLSRGRLLEPRVVQQPLPCGRRGEPEQLPGAVCRNGRAAHPRLRHLHVGSGRALRNRGEAGRPGRRPSVDP